MLGGFGGVLGLDPFAIVDVEHVEVAQHRQALHDGLPFGIGDGLAVGVLLLAGVHLPENNHLGLRALLDAAALLLDLVPGQIFSGRSQEHLVQQRIGAARFTGDCAGGRACPGLVPRDDPVFQFGDDAISDSGVDVKVCHGVILLAFAVVVYTVLCGVGLYFTRCCVGCQAPTENFFGAG